MGTIYASIPGCSGIVSVDYSETLSQVDRLEIVCTGHTLSIGDEVAYADIGYGSDHAQVATKLRVKSIVEQVPEFTYKVTMFGVLINAADAFIAPDNPDVPYEANNVEASVLFGDLLSVFAGIEGYVADTTGFTFGYPEPVPIKLVSCFDVISNIAKITGQTFYTSGSDVYLSNRKPYLLDTDVPTYDVTTVGAGKNVIRSTYTRSDRDLRNRVVVYGAPGVQAVSSGSSPYVPAGYYRTAVIAHELITSGSQAQATADLNLTWLNRLTETYNCEIVGRPASRSRDIIAVTDSFHGLTDEPFFVIATRHSISPSGYVTELTAVK